MRAFEWYSDELKDVMRAWPTNVRLDLGRQIREVQVGGFPARAKWWQGAGPGVIQLKFKGFRTIVSIVIDDVLVVVHAFEKDSAKGSATRKQHVAIVKKRIAELVSRAGKH